MDRLDLVLIGAVMNYDGKVGSFTNYIRQGRRWIAPFQYVYQKRPDHFRNEAEACVYGVPNLSISKVADYLKRNLDSVRIEIIWHFDYHKQELATILREDPPHLVGISTTLAFYPQFLNSAIAWINAHKLPSTRVVIGGKWIYDQYKAHGFGETFEKALIDANPDFAVLNGYGEETLRQLLLALREGDLARSQSLPNVAYRVCDAVVSARTTTDRRPPIASPHPTPAFEGSSYRVNPSANESHTPGDPMIDFRNVGREFLGNVAHVRTCASCPFKCKFCTFPVLGGEYQLFDIDAVIVQLRQLREMGVTHLFFVDDTFNVPKARFEKLMDRMIEAKLDMRWVSFFRAQFANERVVAKMHAAGCRMVFCGFESGNDRILRLMGKNVTVKKYREGLALLAGCGIEVTASYIVGYPGETYETAMDTLALINDDRVGFARGSLFYYDPNAPVREIAAEWDLEGFGNDWRHKTMDSEAAAKIHLEMIDKTTSVNTPVSDGASWSIFNLYAHGLEFEEIKQLYREFTGIQRQQFKAAGDLAILKYRARANERLSSSSRERARRLDEQVDERIATTATFF